MKQSNSIILLSFVTVLLLLAQQVNSQILHNLNLDITENTVNAGDILLDLNFTAGSLLFAQTASQDVMNEYFSYNSGSISPLKNIDREDIANRINTGVSGTFQPVVLTITYVTRDVTTVLRINILDENDNVPMFDSPSAPVEILEASATAAVTLSQATDLDEGLNSIRNYTLTADLDGLFAVSVRYNSETQAISEVRLEVTRPLDRETVSEYTLELVAIEGTENPQRATQTLHVTVLDTCDRPPMFLTTRYFPPNLLENSTTSTIVFNNLTAYDEDLVDQEQPLTYTIYEVCRRRTEINSNCEIFQEPYPFILDSEQGLLVLSEEVDYEEYAVYQVSVHATDKCNLMNSATIVVTIEDVNDNAPEIMPFFQSMSISESDDVILPKTVGFFTITDSDSEDNGQFSLQLYEEVDGQLVPSETFQLVAQGSHMALEFNRLLDREERSEYNVVLIASDFGTPPLSTRWEAILTVRDSNDNSPVINRENLQTVYEINEEPNLNQLIATIQANDADALESGNGEITYHLPDSSELYPFQHLFEIETETGQLKVAGRLDREMQESLFVVVLALDNPLSNGDTPLNDTVRIDIALQDLNDNQPQIHFPLNVFAVSENFTINQKLFTINATDIDSTPFATLSYAVSIAPNDGRLAFSGRDIFLSSNYFDYETTPEYTIEIRVSDIDFTTVEVLTLSVLNINDESPIFNLMSESVVVNILEGSQLMGYHVATINVTDPDGMDENVRLLIASGNERGDFEIDEITGQITTTTSLDKEIVANYTLVIRAFDGLFYTTQDAIVTVNVLDVNDNSPYFIRAPYHFQVDEENIAGTIVRGASDEEIEADDLDTSENGRITFDITGAEPPIAGEWFLINEETGRLSTKIAIDRETSNLGAGGIVQLRVRASNPVTGDANILSTLADVFITVVDIPDQNPTFADQTVSISLPENLETGATFYTAQAVDLDQHPYNLTRYSIVELTPTVADRFHIGVSTGIVTLARTLDHETEPEVRFTIRAEDSVDPINFDDLVVIINVTDTEDPCLKLKNFNPTIDLPEHSSLDTLILSFQATNLQGSTVSTVVYDLTNADGTRSAQFAISVTSHVANIHTTTMNIDREALVAQGNTEAIYILNITAHDTVSTKQCVTIRSFLTVTIIDINDNSPTFTQEEYNFQLAENTPSNSFAGRVVATDMDQGANSMMSFMINDPNVPFVINADGEIRSTTNQLNRDPPNGVPVYTFSVTAQDGGDTPMSSSATVRIHITDENDNTPVFDRTQNRTFYVREDKAVHEKIATIAVTDNDAGDFGQVTLTLDHGSSLDQHFELLSNGDIILRLVLDRETEDQYSFNVRARDGGSRSDTAVINIVVTDVNDNSPIFALEPLTEAIDENQRTGSEHIITRVTATDKDEGLNAAVRFELADSSLKHIFCLLQNTGEVYICPISQSSECTNPVGGVQAPAIDFERQPSYQLNILAYEVASPRHFALKTIDVTIRDVNEYEPRFDSPLVSVVVDEELDSGTVVLRIRAYDLDTLNTPLALTYTVMENEETSENFGYQDGAIVTSTRLDFNSRESYMLVLRAQELDTDEGYYTTVMVIVYVRNVNDRRPVFDTTLYPTATEIPETISPGSVVLTVQANDADNATHDAVYYEIDNGNIGNAFSIDRQTGDVIVAAHLDYDSVQLYSLSIFAKDTGDPQLTSTSLELSITISNVNDESPEFTQNLYEFEFVENSPVGTSVGDVDAPDRDLDAFGRVTYSLPDGDDDYFTVVPSTGDVRSLVEINRETASFYSRSFRVMAIDGGQPALSSFTMVTVSIVDADDNPPQFSHYQYFIYGTSSLTAMTSLLNLANKVTDVDIGTNAEFTFELSSQIMGDLLSVSANGDVMLRSALPSTPLPLYEAQVTVYSALNSDLFDTAHIRLAIDGDNDHHPIFDQQDGYSVNVREDVAITTTVFESREHVSDADTGTNGDISFQFQESYPLFQIESSEGVVSLAMSLDYEQDKTHVLRVAAVDGASRTAETILTVTVLSANDEKPYFEDAPVRLVLSPVPREDIILFTVVARDDDEGSDGTVQYRLLTSDNATSVHFTIDQELGIVRSKGMIPAGNSVDIRVTAYDLGVPIQSSDSIMQIVFQTPPSAPMFAGIDAEPYEIPVNEDHGFGAVYRFASQPQNSQYRLVHTDAPDGLFSVSKSLGDLTLHGPLDSRSRSSYEMYIEAYIEDTTNLDNIIRSSTYLQVIINVVDVNDNAPVFARTMETVRLVESATYTEPVFTAQAFDDDSGLFSELSYVISNGNPDRIFSIDATSGNVMVVGTLDRERYSSYDLTIRASDVSSQPQIGEMTLHVDVDDINDNSPSFIRDGNYSIGVYEYPHTQSGARIIRVSAVDPDTGPPLRYELFVIEARHRGAVVPNPPQTEFEINIDTGMVSLSSSAELDYESLDYYLIRIEASDTVSTTTTYLSLSVLDVNENTPIVTISNNIGIWEQQPLNSFVMQVTTTDADQGLNGVVTYSLDDPDDNFVIDPHTGTIRNKNFIVATSRAPLHTVTVNVTDQGNPPKVTSTKISFRCLDINDHAPQLNAVSYVFGLPVSANPNDFIGQFSASDDDFDENTSIEFNIPHYYNEADGLFEIVTTVGSSAASLVLRDTQNPAWRLKAQNYTFRLEAANDSPSPSCAHHFLSSYADVTVVVYPDCPAFNFTEYSVQVLEDATVLTDERLIATSLVGRPVEYVINEIDTPFVIEKTTGRLMLVRGLDRETKSEYIFKVVATDSIFQPRTCSVTVRVTVIDVNDNSPSFVSEEYDFSVLENTEASRLVGQVVATDDDDIGGNSRITYRLHNSATEVPFRIESETGRLYTDGDLDAEVIETYTFMVVATDSGATQLSNVVSVTVTIGDVNEELPSFTEENFSFPPIGPDTMPGDIVAIVTAQDLDRRSRLTYRFVNDPPKQYFQIDSNTGEILLNVSTRNPSSTNKRSAQKRQLTEAEMMSNYIPVLTEVEVSDGTNKIMTSFELSLHDSFEISPTPAPGISDSLMIIVIVVASVVAVIAVFFLLLIVACVCRYRRVSKTAQIKDSNAVPNNNNMELKQFGSRRSQNSRSSTPGQQKQLSTLYPLGHALRHSPDSRNSSEQSYSNYADDELDSNNEMMGRSAYNSPGSSKRPPNNSAHARSTSDLASSIGTDMLGSQQLPHPKAKIAAIYAAHHGLLNNHGSQESIHSNHTFASEGGGEADAEADIDNMLYRKYEFDDDEDLDDETTIPDDSSYIGKDQQLTNSVGNLVVPPVEEDISPYGAYSQPGMGEWIPRATPMEHTINELSEMAYSSSQEHHIPVHVPRYMEHSQPVSMYGGASSQGSHLSLVPRHHRPQHAPPRHYELPPQMGQPMHHEYDFYGPPPPQEPLRHHHSRRPQPRYSSASALQEYNVPLPRESYGTRGAPHVDPRLHQSHGGHPRVLLSQDVPPTYLQGRYIQRGVNIQTPSSDTPTDGTVTPHRAMTQDYDPREYMSSSSTSLGSTNLSGTTSSIGASASQRMYSK